MLIENRRGGTEQTRIASEEMLIAVDSNWPVFNNAGANSVGPLELFAPHRTCPKARGFECRIVRQRPSPVDYQAAAISQHNRTADCSHRHKQPIECVLGDREYSPEAFLSSD